MRLRDFFRPEDDEPQPLHVAMVVWPVLHPAIDKLLKDINTVTESAAQALVAEDYKRMYQCRALGIQLNNELGDVLRSEGV